MSDAPHELPDLVDVLVVGAGPTGLMLTAELALGGAPPLLVDALDAPTGESRALGFTVRTLEIFQQRGILDRFGDLAQQPSVHFAGIPIDGDHLSSPVRPANQYPQSRTEQALAAWARDLGVEPARPWCLESIEREGDLYACRLRGRDGDHVVRARWVIGCDGAHSRVRECAGIATQRTAPSVQMLLGDLRGSDLPDQPFGVKHEGGMVMSAPLGNGTERVIICDLARPIAEAEDVTDAEVRRAYENVVGRPLGGDEWVWVSAFTDASSLVDSYRDGGILLAGDSAHTHLPAGGQGMNVGIQDAVNLGWKLAAVVTGSADEAILDSYHDERRPVAERLLRNTAAQGQLFLRGPEVDPLRDVIRDLLQVPGVGGRLADGVSGLDVRYPGDGSVGGVRLAPGTLVTHDGHDALVELSAGRPVLFLLADDLALADAIAGLDPSPHVVPARPAHAEAASLLTDATGVLVRPDGHIAWTGADADGLQEALHTRLGLRHTPRTLEV